MKRPPLRQRLIRQIMVRSWCRVLEKTQADMAETFMTAGGDSLKAVELVEELKTSLKVELPIENLALWELNQICDWGVDSTTESTRSLLICAWRSGRRRRQKKLL